MSTTQKRETDELRSLFSVELPEATRRVSTGIVSVDLATGGGFPEGRISEVSGEWQTGKSLICYQALRECQKMGGFAVLDDAERAFDKRWAKILGIDTDPKQFGYFKSKDLEDGFQHLEMFANKVRELDEFKGKFVLYVKDSLEASIAREEAERDFAKAGVAIRARVISRCLRRVTNLIADQNIAVVFVNQLRTNVGVMFGPSEESGGGKAPKFYAGLRCVVKKHGKIFNTDKTKVLGTKGILEVVKSKVGVPFKRTEFEIVFNEGIPRLSGLLDYLVNEGIVTRPTKISYAFRDLTFKAREFPEVWKDNEKHIRKDLSRITEGVVHEADERAVSRDGAEDSVSEDTESEEVRERPRKGKIRKKIS